LFVIVISSGYDRSVIVSYLTISHPLYYRLYLYMIVLAIHFNA